MIKIENVDIHGWEAAIRGMRNPKNSWHKSDSYWTHIENTDTLNIANFQFFVGDADLKLAKALACAGPDHGKFLRFIDVTMDITAPLYWWKEFDTYKVGTVSDSCSTMHTIHTKEFTLDDFSYEQLCSSSLGIADSVEVLDDVICTLNYYRALFLETKNKRYWWQLIQLLPSSFNQRRTIKLNYAVLRAMYHARLNHKLDEWRLFCVWVESLPYSELITCGGDIDHARLVADKTENNMR